MDVFFDQWVDLVVTCLLNVFDLGTGVGQNSLSRNLFTFGWRCLNNPSIKPDLGRKGKTSKEFHLLFFGFLLGPKSMLLLLTHNANLHSFWG
jgi:hypothetical protein